MFYCQILPFHQNDFKVPGYGNTDVPKHELKVRKNAFYEGQLGLSYGLNRATKARKILQDYNNPV